MTRHRHDTCDVGDRRLGRGAVVQVLCGAEGERKIRGLEVAPATHLPHLDHPPEGEGQCGAGF
jgi:hypothetical protein